MSYYATVLQSNYSGLKLIINCCNFGVTAFSCAETVTIKMPANTNNISFFIICFNLECHLSKSKWLGKYTKKKRFTFSFSIDKYFIKAFYIRNNDVLHNQNIAFMGFVCIIFF